MEPIQIDFNEIDAPWKLPAKLRELAETFRDAESELKAAWQDDNPKGWATAAGVFDNAAALLDSRLSKLGLTF